MDNAAKALIIAGAILIAIMLIGLGVLIYSNASSSINDALSGMTSTEIQMHNSKFEAYIGIKVTGTKVRSLVSAVNANNGSSTKVITLESVGGTGTNSDYSKITNIQLNKTYKVEPEYDPEGILNKIKITQN